MSGHSKWSTIKRQKGTADAKRSMTFTKLANLISIAAREGGGDATSNFKLRLAIEKARQANMPKDNIERAIKRGTGELGGDALEELTYEAYAPGGVALLIQVTTDNRNRALASIKAILNKYNAKLAETGAVSYLFNQRGIMRVTGDDPTIEATIIDSGADDYAQDDTGFTVYSAPRDTMAVAQALQAAGLTVSDVEVTMEPITAVMVSDAKIANQLIALVEQLEALDDVSSVASNFDLDPSVALD